MVLADVLGQGPRAHPGSQRLDAGRRLEQGGLIGGGSAGRHPVSLRPGLRAQATLLWGVQIWRSERPSPGSGAFSAVSMPVTNEVTRRGSSCVPAASSRRWRASWIDIALRYGRVVVIALKASATDRIRAISGISSPDSPSR